MDGNAQFRLVPSKEKTPPGWQLATKREVELFKTDVIGILGIWTIAKLQDGWKIDGSGYGNKIMRYGNEGIGEQVIIKIQEAQFRLVPIKEMIPTSWRLATRREVEMSKTDVIGILGIWTIAKLQDGWKIDGSGYGNKIMRYGNEGISEQVIIQIQEQVKEILVIGTAQLIPPGWRWAMKEEVEYMKTDVVKMLSQWSIAKFWGGWKIDGFGYGNKITQFSPNEVITELVIVRTAEVQPDEKKYLDLHETCNKGHSMHHFYGRPPRKDMRTRYSATCRVCGKEALENQPYFMHCYECEYDVCTGCAKLEVHFDQMERTKCKNMHAMKIHRGFLKKNNPVTCNKCGTETSLQEAPYFFHCLKCSESKCITCSRHDIFVMHQFAGFIDTDDNFLQVELEHNEDKMRNELHLYMTPWDSVMSAPEYIKEVKCIKLDLVDRTVAYDDGIKRKVQNTYDYDSWKEFVLLVVPLAKIAHVRVEYYNTHINKSGYPVYNDSASREAYCGRDIIGSDKKCSEDDQCDHCKHFTKKVKAEPHHSWWSNAFHFATKFVSGVLDSIPVVGHIKGAVEYGLGYKEAAKESFEAASRTTVVMGAGVAGFCVGGPAGAVGAGVAAGVLFDAAESGIDSAIHLRWTPHGEMKQFTNIVQGKSTGWDYALLGMDTVFDGLGGADGAEIFKSSIKEGIEKEMAGETERDFDMITAERNAEENGNLAVSGGTQKPIPEFPPDRRVEYHLRDFHWTLRGTGLDETDPMFREIYKELERLPKDDFDIRYGPKEHFLGTMKPWWYYENDAKLKNKTIRDVRKAVHKYAPNLKRCHITGRRVKKIEKGMAMMERRNVDHAFECQVHALVNNSTETTGFSEKTIKEVGGFLKEWQNCDSNLWVLSAEMNVRKRDATNALMRRELHTGQGSNRKILGALAGKNSYLQALKHHGFSTAQAKKVITKIKMAFRDLSNKSKDLLPNEKELVKKFILEASHLLLLDLPLPK